ncbi:MAG: PilW family protein [Polyangiaceae bacterium]
MSARRKRSAFNQVARGFTLVEVMVAMVAGLIVALAVVGLSREATNTFHEETRVASAEMQLRTAIDRLRADLERAAFSSTGNIFIDPQVLTTPGTSTSVNNIAIIGNTTLANCPYNKGTDMNLCTLAGIRLFEGGSPITAATFLSTVNNLSPDAIDIGGNMTGVEILTIGAGSGSGHAAIVAGASACQGQRIYLDVLSTPALWRLVGMSPTGGDATYGQQLVSAFQPVAAASFIVRVEDNTTHKTQFAATCPAAAAVWPPVAGGVPQPYVDLDANANITLSGINPNATINPVQIVRWQIGTSLVNPPGDGGVSDPNKYDLTRQFIDANGNPAGNPEVIAEYAVDLKFAFTIDTSTNTTGNYNGLANSPLVVNAFEEASNTYKNATIAASVATSAPGASMSTNPDPQRIRSVRMRIVTRSAMQDRNEQLTVPEPASPGWNDYLYRYCLVNSVAACNPAVTVPPTLVPLARTRTLISEIALPNQARLWFE